MKIVFGAIISIIFILTSLAVFVKTADKLIKNIDPLAQQIMVIDRSRSPEIKSIKGELIRDLIYKKYGFKDTVFITAKQKR